MANTENQLGLFLSERGITLSEVTRKTGITKMRLSRVTRSKHSIVTACELYLIALSVPVSPGLLLMETCNDICLKNEH